MTIPRTLPCSVPGCEQAWPRQVLDNEHRCPQCGLDGRRSRLPMVAYGTVRAGCGNDWVHRGRTAWVAYDATVRGYRLVGLRAFPYAIPTEGASIACDVFMPHDDDYADVQRLYDQLEGVPHHYERVLVDVEIPGMTARDGGPIRAWMYSPPGARAGRGEDRMHDTPCDDEGRHNWLVVSPRRAS